MAKKSDIQCLSGTGSKNNRTDPEGSGRQGGAGANTLRYFKKLLVGNLQSLL